MNDHDPPRIYPLGERALVVEFGRVISSEFNQKAIALADLLDRQPFKGYIESLPAYASTTIFFDPTIVSDAYPNSTTSSEAVSHLVEPFLFQADAVDVGRGRLIEIHGKFGNEAGPDLDSIAEAAGLEPKTVIKIFTAATYRVYMLGFLPGFAYMGDVDERIAAPRRTSPRLSVPAGSIGIAGRQTGIYSLESPGGWQIIGRTDMRLFDPFSEEPSLLKAGDLVKFVPSPKA